MDRRHFLSKTSTIITGYGILPNFAFLTAACNSASNRSKTSGEIYPSYDSFDTVLKESELPSEFFVEDSLEGGVFKSLKDTGGRKSDSIVKRSGHHFKRIEDVNISVKQFGAVGDGVTDDSNAVSKAFEFVNNNSGSYQLHFPQGNYVVFLKVSSNKVHVNGKGTLIPLNGKVEYALRIDGNENTIDGLKFYEKSFCRNLLIVNGNNNRITNCQFDSPKKSTSKSVVYSDRLLFISKNDGIGNVIENCKFNNGRVGVGLCGNYKFLNSEVSNCIMGIYARPSSRNSEIGGNTIRDNDVTNKSGADGIYAQRNVSNLHIYGNKIYNSGEHGIYFQGDNSVIEKNEVFNNFGSGIKLASYTDQLYNVAEKERSRYIGHNNVIRNNRCYNNCKGQQDTTNAGIYLQAPLTDIEVSNNVCYGNYHGIRSTSVASTTDANLDKKAVLKNLKIANNNVQDNRGRSIYIEGESGILILNNEVDNILTNAKSASHRLRGAIIRGNKIKGELHINRAENTVIEDNEIKKLNINNNSRKGNRINLDRNRIEISNVQ